MACIVLALGVLLGCPGLGVAQQGEGPAFERCETLTQPVTAAFEGCAILTTKPVTAGYNELTTFGYNYKVMVEDASDLTSYVFTVRAVTDAHVALNDGSAPFFEIPIGAWRNSRSVIRIAKQGTNLVEHYETLLDSNRFRQFWVSWMDGVVKVGKGCTVGVDEFMRYTHGAPFTVNKISVACIGQLTAYWRIPDYDPVCGTDGSTYSSACEARCKNVRVSSRGECPSRRCVCPQDYDPVCGTDGSTYSNACEARCKNIQVASRGECCVCDPINDPVCGTDGTTYPNECEANCKNVPVQSKGDCSQRRKNCHGTTRFLSCL